jgi:hypothetical protein
MVSQAHASLASLLHIEPVVCDVDLFQFQPYINIRSHENRIGLKTVD